MDKNFIDAQTENNTDVMNNVISYKEMQDMTIEELAQLIKFAELAEYKVEAARDLLAKKLAKKAHQGWATMSDQMDKTLEELPGADKNSGISSTKALNYALGVYGKLDANTGLLIPFEKHYWAAFGLKNQDAVNEFLTHTRGEEQKARQEAVKELVRTVAERNGKEKEIPRISLLKKDNLLQVLGKVGATAEEIKKGEKLLEEALVVRDVCYDDKGEECGSYLSDSTSITNYNDAESAADMVVSGLECAFLLAETEKEKQSLRCLVTLRFDGYRSSGNYASVNDFSKFVDADLKAILETTCEKDKDVLMDYMGVKDRELRRRMARAQELLYKGLEMAYGRNTAA